VRLKQLDLIKYGKFSDTSIEFSSSEYDFHVVCGPNEAGKSTIRGAISELLFGMPLRTKLDFVFPLQDLKLGGVVENDSASLAFHRCRGRNPLRTAEDAPLSESNLAPFLGAVDKSFFEQMFGLDHTQLVKGGQSILDGSKDVGQVLFQSAAGIAGLGSVREELQEQSANLWAPRAKSTEFAQAFQRLEEVSAELRAAQVKTKAWTDAKNVVDEVTAAIVTAEAKRAELETKRSTLERVRRLSPILLSLKAKAEKLIGFGEIVDFPAGAYDELTSGQAAWAIAQAQLETRTKDLADRQAELAALTFDSAILPLQKDIEALESLRTKCLNHPRELLLRCAEVDRLLESIKERSQELGWPQDEAEIRACLPSHLGLKTVKGLVRDHGALHEAVRKSIEAVEKKCQEVKKLDGELAGIEASDVPKQLKQALSDAQAHKTSPSKQRILSEAVKQLQQRVDNLLSAHAPWMMDVTRLRTLPLPSAERIAALKSERLKYQSRVLQAEERLADAQKSTGDLGIQIAQFAKSHKLVTKSDVLQARAERDATWVTVKTGKLPLADGTPILDTAIKLADELVDSQLGSATDAANLQNLRDRYELAIAEVQRLESTLLERAKDLETHRAQWRALLVAPGLSGLDLDDAAAWLSKRDMALIAHEALVQKQQELDAEIAAYDTARSALHHTLKALEVELHEDDELISLCVVAEEFVSNADNDRQRKKTLTDQRNQAIQTLEDLERETKSAENRFKRWQLEWTAAIEAARLSQASTNLSQAEAAVDLVSEVADDLNKIDSIRRDHIESMQGELDALRAAAARLAAATGLAISDEIDPSEIAKTLGEQCRATLALAQQKELLETAVRTALGRRNEAQESVRSNEARLRPLLDLAETATAAEVLPLIERSDTKRRLAAEISEARDTLLADGEGLSIEELEQETGKYNPREVPALLEEAKSGLSEVSEELVSLHQKKVVADQTYSVIAGQADAAVAEAKRNEVLAAMGDTAEQYLETATASKLLKWAIDRYRDRKQGPMLQRASEVFSGLTLSEFSNLGVDYEKETPALYARRQNGRIVEVAGLSEGTRDQLYLALRIAALELHLGQSVAMPFIADDLFINFDDERSRAGLQALRSLSRKTQVIFLTHHTHLLSLIEEIFGAKTNIRLLEREPIGFN